MPPAFPRHRLRRRRYRWWAVVVVLLIVVAGRWLRDVDAPPEGSQQNLIAVRLQRVVDGDTLLLTSGTRVRLIGVDTPETVKPDTPPQPWGREASEFSKRFTSGGALQLEYDLERSDEYGRTLAYVWVQGRMLNEELVRAGLARVEPNYRYDEDKKRRFRAAQDEARRARRGLWSSRPLG